MNVMIWAERRHVHGVTGLHPLHPWKVIAGVHIRPHSNKKGLENRLWRLDDVRGSVPLRPLNAA